jgi:N6-adenosine-specific RNA methylase IME4
MKKTKAKRTGPSRRTAAARAAIDKRAAEHSKKAKREQRVRLKAAKAKPKSIAAALAPLVTETAGNKGRASAKATPHRSPGVPTIDIGKIKIGKRHRKDFSHVPALARSINERGGLIQPISLKPDFTLIAGESRIRAWQASNFSGQPIPYHVLDVDSIIAGEWDENATRKDFTPAEAVSIKRDIEKELRKLAALRPAFEKPAPGRKAKGREGPERTAARLTGLSHESIRKAEAVVDAAASEPEKHGDLLDEMNRSGKVNAAHKKLQVRQAKAAIEAAPPALPMNAKECATWLIDFPWAGELEADQAKLDAAGRAFRPYPEMSIKTICAYARDEIAPRLPADVALWLCVTNFVLVRGYHMHVYGALGLKPENAATMLTWGKDRIGRGQILRDQTEHAILLTRGKVTIDVFGKDPPSTLLNAARGENSQKPRALYELIARVTPAKRYAEIFSTGAHGLADWDCHGDQVGKHAAAPAEVPATPIDAIADLNLLELIADGQSIKAELVDPLRELGFVSGRKEIKLTKVGLERLDELRQARDAAAAAAYAAAPAAAEAHQIDLEEAIAAKASAADPSDPGPMPAFLRRNGAEASA